jgi:hypothetical protein
MSGRSNNIAYRGNIDGNGNFEEIPAANEIMFSTSSVEAGDFLSLCRIDVSGGLEVPFKLCIGAGTFDWVLT